jgi:16S rRNA processing protein RimM
MESSRKSGTPPPRNGPGAPVEALVVGVLVGPHGVRGEVKLRPVTEFPERIPQLEALRLRYPDGREERRRLLAAREHKGMFLLTLEGVETMDDARALRGAEAVVGLEEAAPLPEGRYYEHQLLGLRVVTPDGEELGTVTEIMPGAANDVYVAGRYLIPATHDAVLRLAPDEGVIVVRSREYLEGEEAR